MDFVLLTDMNSVFGEIRKMIEARHRKSLFVLSVITSVITIAVSAAGIIYISIYKGIVPAKMLPGVMSQDIVSFISAFGLLVTMCLIKKGSGRAWIVWLGLTGYLLYAYALYAFDGVYNLFYLFYVAIFGLCVYTVIMFFIKADFSVFTTDYKKALPRKSAAVFLLVLTVMFLLIWMSMIIPGILANEPPAGNSIFVMDLSFFLPLLVICAFQLLHGRPFGDFLASVLLVKMGTLGFSVFLGELLNPLFGRGLHPPMIAVFALLSLGGIMFAVLYLNRLAPSALEG